ncbi:MULTISPECIES: hypothetical protein [unclassified Mesorhizobium]|uniref:hypothetical protein n=1 Tax=unclassified Mesorhizobium TaxID=325217 RepID=UPI00301456E6
MSLRTIGLDELNNFQLDEKGRLYWKGETVILEKKVSLETYQIVLLTLGTVGALLAGIHPFGQSFGWW